MLLLPRYARRHGLDPDVARRAFLMIFVGGALGCRLLFVLLNIGDVIRNPSVVWWMIRQAGVWYGALIGGLIVGIFVVRRFRIPFWTGLDVAAVPVLVGGGVGRIGCFLSGCCHGTASSLPWAVTYTNPLAHELHAQLPWTPLHPTVLYELLVAVGLALLLDRYGATRPRTGQTGLLWFAAYGIARFFLEFFRADAVRGHWGALSTSQLISLVAVAVALAAWFARGRAPMSPVPTRSTG